MSDLNEIDKFFNQIKNIKDRSTLIHTQLTHDIDDVNLKAIETLKNTYDIPVAFGNHTENHNVLYLSLAYRPSDIFMYIKGNQEASHPDEEHAITIEEMDRVINNLILLPRAIGDGMKIKMDNWV